MFDPERLQKLAATSPLQLTAPIRPAPPISQLPNNVPAKMSAVERQQGGASHG